MTSFHSSACLNNMCLILFMYSATVRLLGWFIHCGWMNSDIHNQHSIAGISSVWWLWLSQVRVDLGSKCIPVWMSSHGMSTVMLRTLIPQTYGNVKALPKPGSGSDKAFPWSLCGCWLQAESFILPDWSLRPPACRDLPPRLVNLLIHCKYLYGCFVSHSPPQSQLFCMWVA